ncbi:MAG: exodeoxyribonuclease VII large subunit [Bacteroidales bacterium]|jgi:exodeoxyribonuclease VII large subunit|nr:exodeoxyribonuclease VII large subunit [Bacteroidales bacterium]
MESCSLLMLNRLISQSLKQSVSGLYWVVAEIYEMRVGSSGHCFLELIEKEDGSERIVARAKANIWAYYFRIVHPYFKTMTGRELAAGMKVMFHVSVEFHELYGVSLQVTDVNPAYTVGELALQKQAILKQLEDEGVIEMNKESYLAEIPNRIAVISSKTAAGYGDFLHHLHDNPYGYAFVHTLFPAIMQGNEAETSIIASLDLIFEREDEFDAVVIIRGGGAQSDLNCFNSYRLACRIAQFPLPVITGIGHERDETIADTVAFAALKTPTAVAGYLIDLMCSFDNRLQELSLQFVESAQRHIRLSDKRMQEQSHKLYRLWQTILHVQDRRLQAYGFTLSRAAAEAITHARNENFRQLLSVQLSARKMLQTTQVKLPDYRQRLAKSARSDLNNCRKRTEWLDDKLQLLNPQRLLERGYSITLVGGKTVHSANQLRKGQSVTTIFSDGKTESTVTAIEMLPD